MLVEMMRCERCAGVAEWQHPPVWRDEAGNLRPWTPGLFRMRGQIWCSLECRWSWLREVVAPLQSVVDRAAERERARDAVVVVDGKILVGQGRLAALEYEKRAP